MLQQQTLKSGPWKQNQIGIELQAISSIVVGNHLQKQHCCYQTWTPIWQELIKKRSSRSLNMMLLYCVETYVYSFLSCCRLSHVSIVPWNWTCKVHAVEALERVTINQTWDNQQQRRKSKRKEEKKKKKILALLIPSLNVRSHVNRGV